MLTYVQDGSPSEVQLFNKILTNLDVQLTLRFDDKIFNPRCTSTDIHKGSQSDIQILNQFWTSTSRTKVVLDWWTFDRHDLLTLYVDAGQYISCLHMFEELDNKKTLNSKAHGVVVQSLSLFFSRLLSDSVCPSVWPSALYGKMLTLLLYARFHFL